MQVLSMLKGCVLIGFWVQKLETVFVLENSTASHLKLYSTICHRILKPINHCDGNKKNITQF